MWCYALCRITTHMRLCVLFSCFHLGEHDFFVEDALTYQMQFCKNLSLIFGLQQYQVEVSGWCEKLRCSTSKVGYCSAVYT